MDDKKETLTEESVKSDDVIYIDSADVDVVDEVYLSSVEDGFDQLPEVARPLINNAKQIMMQVQEWLYNAPAFINLLKASVPKEIFQAVLTNEQSKQLKKGVIKLMTKKNGDMMANLINAKTKKIVATVPLSKQKISPNIDKALNDFGTQMQMAQIAEQIQEIMLAVKEVQQGLEYDRLAMAYSCQQKFIQAMEIEDKDLRIRVLMQIALDAEDARNLLMLSQKSNIEFIINQPESFWGKMINGKSPDKIVERMNQIRSSLVAVNMVSFAEAMAYLELGEEVASRKSLDYYADYLKRTYLSTEGLVERLDLIDPSPENYWTKNLPKIQEKIESLPEPEDIKMITGGN